METNLQGEEQEEEEKEEEVLLFFDIYSPFLWNNHRTLYPSVMKLCNLYFFNLEKGISKYTTTREGGRGKQTIWKGCLFWALVPSPTVASYP